MIPRIKEIIPLPDFILQVKFDDETVVFYDVKEDINQISQYGLLQTQNGLFEKVKLDQSRTIIFWTDDIDLPSDMVYEYGKRNL